MIKDKLINADTYYGLSNSIKAGLEWLRSADLVNIKDGQYFIDGNRIFVNVQSYETKKEASFEAHRKYVDIQYMIKGAEKIGIADYSSCTPITEYDKDKDIEFLNFNNFPSFLPLREGEFMIFYPQDAHLPSLDLDKKLFVKKAVVKVAL